MLTKACWDAECELMREHFPEFEPFVKPDEERHGFHGKIIGPRTGTTYNVTIVETKAGVCPQEPPLI